MKFKKNLLVEILFLMKQVGGGKPLPTQLPKTNNLKIPHFLTGINALI